MTATEIYESYFALEAAKYGFIGTANNLKLLDSTPITYPMKNRRQMMDMVLKFSNFRTPIQTLHSFIRYLSVAYCEMGKVFDTGITKFDSEVIEVIVKYGVHNNPGFVNIPQYYSTMNAKLKNYSFYNDIKKSTIFNIHYIVCIMARDHPQVSENLRITNNIFLFTYPATQGCYCVHDILNLIREYERESNKTPFMAKIQNVSMHISKSISDKRFIDATLPEIATINEIHKNLRAVTKLFALETMITRLVKTSEQFREMIEYYAKYNYIDYIRILINTIARSTNRKQLEHLLESENVKLTIQILDIKI